MYQCSIRECMRTILKLGQAWFTTSRLPLEEGAGKRCSAESVCAHQDVVGPVYVRSTSSADSIVTRS